MSVAAFIKNLRARGWSLDKIEEAVEAFEAAIPAYEHQTARQARNARYYQNKRLKASESKTDKTLSDVSDASKTSKTLSDAEPRAHVRDNLPKLVISGNQTTLNDAGEPDLDWPETDKPSRAYLDKLEAALREAGGLAIASPAVAPGIASLAPILALGRAGKGPPCDLQADVLPTIRARSARSAPNSVKGWGYFRDAILEARDRRLTGAPAVSEIVPFRGTGPPRTIDEKSSASWDYAIAKIAQDEQRQN